VYGQEEKWRKEYEEGMPEEIVIRFYFMVKPIDFFRPPVFGLHSLSFYKFGVTEKYITNI